MKRNINNIEQSRNNRGNSKHIDEVEEKQISLFYSIEI